VRGLIESGRLSSEGSALVDALQAALGNRAAPIWRDLAADDVAATERVLNEIIRRGRLVLSAER